MADLALCFQPAVTRNVGETSYNLPRDEIAEPSGSPRPGVHFSATRRQSAASASQPDVVKSSGWFEPLASSRSQKEQAAFYRPPAINLNRGLRQTVTRSYFVVGTTQDPTAEALDSCVALT